MHYHSALEPHNPGTSGCHLWHVDSWRVLGIADRVALHVEGMLGSTIQVAAACVTFPGPLWRFAWGIQLLWVYTL
jgi:hypothetical protein